MDILLWIIFGGLVGWVASFVMDTEEQQGVLLNVFVGIIGAVIGGWIMSLFGESGVNGFNLYSLLVAFVGAIILLIIVKTLTRKTIID